MAGLTVRRCRHSLSLYGVMISTRLGRKLRGAEKVGQLGTEGARHLKNEGIRRREAIMLCPSAESIMERTWLQSTVFPCISNTGFACLL
jgi:hypothetical protein